MQAHIGLSHRRGTAAVLAASLLTLVPAPAGARATPFERVVVTLSAGAGELAAAAADAVRTTADAVRGAGGRVVTELPLLGGVVAELPTGSRLAPYVFVAPDRPVHVSAVAAGTAETASTVRATLGLPAAGSEGAGVTVAVVDTGVADVADLAGVEHVDVTGTGTGDGYGHGTFMAGLVAGSGASSDGAIVGVAPAARVLDVKVADNDGNTSLSVVLRGLEVVARRPDVRVLNLSLSSNSPLPWQHDPLTRALDALWARGVVVVVPAGNDGPDARTITSPGSDPTLLTVGGLDEGHSASRADDSVAAWSARGPAQQHVAKPDVVAPGAHLLSLRSPGSVIDSGNPASRVGEQYFRGSGTSMATAVTSGAVAALLSSRPRLTPDQVKAVVTGTAYAGDALDKVSAAGAGGLALDAALTAAVPKVDVSQGPGPRRAHQLDLDAGAWEALAISWSAGNYAATVQAWSQLRPVTRAWAARAWSTEVWSRGQGLTDAEWAARAWTARSWSNEEWLARAWSARSWSGDDWASRAWTARAWSGISWSGISWAGVSWSAISWSGISWSNEDWTARAWSNEEWTARAWISRAWTSRAWTARAWTARAWSAASWS